MHPFIEESRDRVRKRLSDYVHNESALFLTFEPWSADVRTRLGEYALRGKLMRGALVGLGYRLFQPKIDFPDACVDAGAAMELIQSFLLIHDDIMDQDETRRGLPAVHAQYALDAPDGLGPPEKAHYGISMGITAGDVAAFLAIELLSTLDASAEVRADLTALAAREIAGVGLAQMQDVHHGYVDHAERDAIMSVYTHKTGRYTFSLPLIIGARLGDADEEARRLLARLGESLGRIFQIRDDHLGVFGTEGETGKPVGTDLRENKKTLHRRLLFDRLDPDDPVRALFGASDVRPEHVTAVRTAMRRYGVPAEIEHEIQREQSSAESAIEELNVSPQGREALKALLAYNLTRTK